MMERIYETPAMEVLLFQCDDVITASGRDEVLPEMPVNGEW